MKRAVILASFPGLLTPAFDTCSTNMGEGMVKLITCNDYLDIGCTCGGVPHSQNNCKCAIDCKHRPWNGWVLDTRQSWRHFLGSESRFTAVHKEHVTPPHIYPTSRSLHVISFTRPSLAFVLEAANARLKRHGYEAPILLQHIILVPLFSCLYTGHESSMVPTSILASQLQIRNRIRNAYMV